jgi:hypothetical protein
MKNNFEIINNEILLDVENCSMRASDFQPGEENIFYFNFKKSYELDLHFRIEWDDENVGGWDEPQFSARSSIYIKLLSATLFKDKEEIQVLKITNLSEFENKIRIYLED